MTNAFAVERVGKESYWRLVIVQNKWRLLPFAIAPYLDSEAKNYNIAKAAADISGSVILRYPR
jgi:hypothetical protein